MVATSSLLACLPGLALAPRHHRARHSRPLAPHTASLRNLAPFAPPPRPASHHPATVRAQHTEVLPPRLSHERNPSEPTPRRPPFSPPRPPFARRTMHSVFAALLLLLIAVDPADARGTMAREGRGPWAQGGRRLRQQGRVPRKHDQDLQSAAQVRGRHRGCQNSVRAARVDKCRRERCLFERPRFSQPRGGDQVHRAAGEQIC